MRENSSSVENRLSRRNYLRIFSAAGLFSGAGSGTAAAHLSRNTPPQTDTESPQRLVTDKLGESIVVNETTESIGPGVILTSFDRVDQNGWIRADLLKINLAEEATSAGLLSPGVSSAAPVSELAEEADAIAGTNGDFFDIGDTNAPIGFEVGNGTINKSGDRPSAIGTNAEGLAQVMDLALDGAVTLPTGKQNLDTFNDPTLTGDDLGLYTPLWGDASLSSVVEGTPTVREVRVVNNTVTGSSSSVSGDPIPENGYILIGRGTGAQTLSDLSAGDEISVEYSASYSVSSSPEFAVGANPTLVKGGSIALEPTENASRAPRTAAGVSSDGSNLLLMTIDGRQRFSRGATLYELAALMQSQGVEDAMNLDGGGSTTLVTRKPGTDKLSVENSPSDGSERPVPNGVGIFTSMGNDGLKGIRVTPRSGSDYANQIFPGLSRDFLAYGFDDSYAPVDVKQISWVSNPGSLGKVRNTSEPKNNADSLGTFTARKSGNGSIRARRQGTTGKTDIRVLDELDRIEMSMNRLNLSDVGSSASVEVIGYDKEGYRAPIEPRDVELEYDDTIVSVETNGTELTITGATSSGSELVNARVDDQSTFLTVTIGLSTKSVSGFENSSDWDVSTYPSFPASIDFVSGRDGTALKLTYDFSTLEATRAAYVDPTPTIEFPGEPQRIGLWVNGDGNGAWLRGKVIDATDTSSNLSFASSIDWNGWRYVEAAVPDGVEYPLKLDHIYPVETSSDAQYSGTLLFDNLQVSVAPAVERPDSAPVRDQMVLTNERIGSDAWQFAVMSDSQFTADNPDNSIVQQTRRTLREIRDADPDFLVINGDFVDRGTEPDFKLAQRILNEEIGDSLPYYYVPGNHEIEGTDSLSNFDGYFGETRRTFDHKRIRFVLLNSSSGGFRASDFSQLLDLQRTLEESKGDDSIDGLILIAHHPLDDPLPANNSQLSDRQEANMIKQWLRKFELDSDKEAAYIASHASSAYATHLGGVNYLVTPTSGKDPYGPPNNGGFTGWVMFGASPSKPDPEWLQAAMYPHVDEIRFEVPDNLEVGQEATVSATAIQPGGRRIPLRYPATVRWKASENVFVGNGISAAEAITRGKYDAVYNYESGSLTVLDAGTFSLTVETNESSATHEFTVDSKIAYLKPDSTDATVGERIGFNVLDGTDNSHWIDSLAWEFGDGTTTTGWWSAHRYDTPGEYDVQLTATDNIGRETTHELTITISELTSPIARIRPSTTEASVGERIAFEVEDTSGSKRWIDSLSWAFGDGTTATGWWNSHQYTTSGKYTVRLTAIDNTGHSTTDEMKVIIS